VLPKSYASLFFVANRNGGVWQFSSPITEFIRHINLKREPRKQPQ
jgi:cell division protein YceG involved in septum cleavage